MKIVAKNRRAAFDYELGDRLVAGLVLTGAEVKSIKNGHVSLKGSFISLNGGEAYLNNAHVTPYNQAGNQSSLEPTRPRKLLLHQRELDELASARQTGHQLIPTVLGVERNLVKLELAISRSKKQYDKREVIKRRETDREARRVAKNA